MNSNELKKEMNMNYEELTLYLQKKYDKPSRAYFRTATCKSKSPITRGDEGLYIHHIKETEVDNLAQPEQAIEYPWEWQLPENLCYCNLLEHLLLHIHINKKRCEEQNMLVIDGVLNHIVPELNHIYLDNPVYTSPNTLWRNKVKEEIIDNYEEYKEILANFNAIISNYIDTNIEILLNWKEASSNYISARVKLRGLQDATITQNLQDEFSMLISKYTIQETQIKHADNLFCLLLHYDFLKEKGFGLNCVFESQKIKIYVKHEDHLLYFGDIPRKDLIGYSFNYDKGELILRRLGTSNSYKFKAWCCVPINRGQEEELIKNWFSGPNKPKTDFNMANSFHYNDFNRFCRLCERKL